LRVPNGVPKLPVFSAVNFGDHLGQLNDLQIKAAQPRSTEYLLADGEGLYLRVRPTAKVWIYRYRRDGKSAKLSLGHYLALSLAAARILSRAEAEKLACGGDPIRERRAEQERVRVACLNTFERAARAWLVQASKDRLWSAGYAGKVQRHLELHIFPWLDRFAMDTIAQTELVRCLHRIRDRGHLETAQRVRETVQHVYQYTVDVGILQPSSNFVNKRTGGLPSPRARHYAAITDPHKFGQLLRDMAEAMMPRQSVDGVLVQWGERLFYPDNRRVRTPATPSLRGPEQ
jgi:hypothetical protein